MVLVSREETDFLFWKRKMQKYFCDG